MGYRSEIYIKVKKKDEAELISILKEHDLFGEDYGFRKEDSDDDGEYARYYGSYLKWYDSYEDVKAVNDFINAGTEEEPRGLIAVGEDSATTHYGTTSYLDMYEVTRVEW